MFVCEIQVRLMLGDYLKFTTRGYPMGDGIYIEIWDFLEGKIS
jgi:hypothetical protein